MPSPTVEAPEIPWLRNVNVGRKISAEATLAALPSSVAQREVIYKEVYAARSTIDQVAFHALCVALFYFGLILALLLLAGVTQEALLVSGLLAGLVLGAPVGYAVGAKAQTRERSIYAPVWTFNRSMFTVFMLIGFFGFLALAVALAGAITA